MKVYKLTLTGDKKRYWLTEKVVKPIMLDWREGKRGTFTLKQYGIMAELSRIKEIRAEEESEPYPEEFKKMLAEEGSMSLPAPDKRIVGISKLPAEWLLLDMDLNILPLTEDELFEEWKKNHEVREFYLAKVHYKSENGKKEYFLSRDLIRTLIHRRFSGNVYHASVVSEYNYGIENTWFTNRRSV